MLLEPLRSPLFILADEWTFIGVSSEKTLASPDDKLRIGIRN